MSAPREVIELAKLDEDQSAGVEELAQALETTSSTTRWTEEFTASGKEGKIPN